MKYALKGCLIFAVLFCCQYVTLAQNIITTIAGNGFGGYPDSGIATSIPIPSPGGVMSDNSGNIYFSTDAKIYRINTATGYLTTVAGIDSATSYSGGGGLATASSIGIYIWRMYKDNHGNIFFSEENTIGKIDTAGIYTIIAGDTGGGGSMDEYIPFSQSQIRSSCGITGDSAGNLYIGFGSCVRKVDAATGLVHTIAGSTTAYGTTGDGGPATDALFTFIQDLCMDNEGNLFVVDEYNASVRKIDLGTGIVTCVAGMGGDPTSSVLSGLDSAATNAHLAWPGGICCDTAGNIFINGFDLHGHYTLKVDKNTGIISHIAGNLSNAGYGGDGGNALEALLSYPLGICYNSMDGSIVIADHDNGRVRKVTPGVPSSVNTPFIKNSLAVFPNPSSGLIHLTCKNQVYNPTLRIYNPLGRMVYSCMIKASNEEVDLSNLDNGLYFITLEGQETHMSTPLMLLK